MGSDEREQRGPRSRWQAAVAFVRWLAEAETLPRLEPPVAPRGLLGSVATLVTSSDQLPAPPPAAPAPARPGFLSWLAEREQLPAARTTADQRRPGLLATLMAREELPAAPEATPTPSLAAPRRAVRDKE